ncbi:hypothetical protein [Flavobacterium algicola]|uniref:hypothetical protein n=1 Tax=Flavobacterium algicola TaxID=556529 RepID=UPI001EFE4FAF|nr:hypothetical protein [Flavobacterium algicola]MCG9792630.1 hypothetical protein [Flavobacterium algicola]
MQHITGIPLNQLFFTNSGIQSHKCNRFRKSKWRTQFNYVGLQHQTQYQNTERSRFNYQTSKMELTIQGKSLAFAKNDVFKPEYRLPFVSN